MFSIGKRLLTFHRVSGIGLKLKVTNLVNLLPEKKEFETCTFKVATYLTMNNTFFIL